MTSRTATSIASLLLCAAVLAGATASDAATVGPAAGCVGRSKLVAGKTVSLSIVRQSLPMVLQLVAEQAGLQVVVEDGVSGDLAEVDLDGSLELALDQVAERSGNVWWLDNGTLRFASRRSIVTRQVPFPVPQALADAIEAACLPSAVLAIQPLPAAGMVTVAGPSTVVAQVETLAQSLAKTFGEVRVTRYGQASIQSLSR